MPVDQQLSLLEPPVVLGHIICLKHSDTFSNPTVTAAALVTIFSALLENDMTSG